MIYKPVEQAHYCVEVFSDYHVKIVYILCVIKNLHQSVPYAQNESCLAYKETENG